MSKRVAIVALGPSAEVYYRIAESHGDRNAYADETWAINTNASVITCDRVFAMDDIRVQEMRADAGNEKIARLLKWMKKAPAFIPTVYTSRAHSDYPALIEYPLQDVINYCGTPYFNSTSAYAVAFALYLKRSGQMDISWLGLFGFDFTWPDRHEAERGRACVEYWVSRCQLFGIDIFVPAMSTLLDANVSIAQKLYGYDTLDVSIKFVNNERVEVTFTERAVWPTLEEIEKRYDHVDARFEPSR